MLSVFEASRVREVLLGPKRAKFIRGAAELAVGDYAKGLAAMERAISPHGRHSWPIVTCLPSMWRPEEHIFLKLDATLDFAERVEHDFVNAYESDLIASGFESLLDLANVSKLAIESLNPVDGIDVQSFLWVVGDYQEGDVRSPPEIELKMVQ